MTSAGVLIGPQVGSREQRCHRDSFSSFLSQLIAFLLQPIFLEMNKADDKPAFLFGFFGVFFLEVLKSNKKIDDRPDQ